MYGENLSFQEREDGQPLDFLRIRRFSEDVLAFLYLSQQLWGVWFYQTKLCFHQILLLHWECLLFQPLNVWQKTYLALENFGKKQTQNILTPGLREHMISSKVRLNCGNCLFACGSNFKGSEQKIFTVKSDDVVEYTLQIPVPTTLDEHPCLQLDCSCRICRRCKFQAWWRSAENLSGSRKNTFH